MPFVILIIIAVLAVGAGIFIYFKFGQAPTYEELINARCESIVWILVGIFFILLALLFKQGG